jgi:hypothetical protein
MATSDLGEPASAHLLFWQHVLPYSEVKLDMTTRLSIRTTVPAAGA